MKNDVIILVAEDDDGHFSLIEKNLIRTGMTNQVIRFTDGQQTIEFLNNLKDSSFSYSKHPCLLLLDIRMPKVDGLQILKFVKTDPDLKKIPVIVLTTADYPEVADECRGLGCNMFVTKPVKYEEFMTSMNRIGHFLSIIEVPTVIS